MNIPLEHNPQNADIKLGTLVRVDGDPSAYIRQIAPYGFESYALTFWQTLRGVDLQQLGPKVRDVAAESGATISCIALYGNLLGAGELDRETLRGLESAIDSARAFGAEIVGGFTGRLHGLLIHACFDRFSEVWEPLARRAADNGVRIAFENCGMGGDWQSGDWNIAHNPTAREMMFEAVPAENLGLEWEPCHQMMSLIDPIPQLRRWVNRVFHVNGKDASVHWDVIRRCGIHGRWRRFLTCRAERQGCRHLPMRVRQGLAIAIGPILSPSCAWADLPARLMWRDGMIRSTRMNLK